MKPVQAADIEQEFAEGHNFDGVRELLKRFVDSVVPGVIFGLIWPNQGSLWRYLQGFVDRHADLDASQAKRHRSGVNRFVV